MKEKKGYKITSDQYSNVTDMSVSLLCSKINTSTNFLIFKIS